LALAERFSLPAAYDAHYLALADWLGGEFWTADRKLVRAVEDELPWVRVVEV
jgi:predicted nucleic acid-binding protein